MLEVHVCLYWTSTTLEKYYRILSSGLFKQARFCWKFTKFCSLWILYGWPSRQEQVGSATMFTSLWYATPPDCCHAKMTNSHNLCCYATARSALPPLLAQFNICLLLMQYWSKTTKNYFLVTARKICTTSKKENKREPNLQHCQRCRQSSVYNRKF